MNDLPENPRQFAKMSKGNSSRLKSKMARAVLCAESGNQTWPACKNSERILWLLVNFGVKVNLCQKFLFLHQLTHNMTKDCSLNYKFNAWNLGRTCCVQKLFLLFRIFFVHNMFSPCSAKRRDSDKDLPVKTELQVKCSNQRNITEPYAKIGI